MSKTMTPNSDPNRRHWLWGLMLVILTLAVYSRVVVCGYIWDDDFYVTQNQTLNSLSGLADIWFQPGATAQYYPLVFTGFWIEHALWGLAPLGYHLTNVLLHAASVLLLWRLLELLGLSRRVALIGAALFAAHPVHVESVAWITERKNVLSGLFYLAATWMYLRFDQTRHRRFWFGALGLFICALLSKTVVATFPAAILVVLWWRRGRLGKRDFLPTLPFWCVGAAFGVVTVLMEKHHVGAQGASWDHNFAERILISGHVIVFYLGKLLWPHPLIFTYPRWNIDATQWRQWCYPLGVLLALSGLAWWAIKRRSRGLLAGALFFCGSLFPALGFFDVFPFTYSYVADHFQYLASLGILVLIAQWLNTPFPGRPASRKPIFAWQPVLALFVIVLLGILTWRQIGVYRDASTLWQDTIRKNPKAWMAYNNLGVLSIQKGDEQAAIQFFQTSLSVHPGYAEAHNNLGSLALQKARMEQAIRHYQAALASRPDFFRAQVNLGVALAHVGRHAEAVIHYRAALKVMPSDLVEGRLSQSLLQLHQNKQAHEHQKIALRMNPDQYDALLTLGQLQQQQGQKKRAIQTLRRAVQINPSMAKGHVLLGKLFSETGKTTLSQKHLAAAAWTLATHPLPLMRDGDKAMQLISDAIALNPQSPFLPRLLDIQAAGYAQVGQFDQALATLERAIRLAKPSRYRQLLQTQRKPCYQQHQPWREPLR